MAWTLEQGLVMDSTHGLKDVDDAVKTLRCRGTRRQNVFKNIWQRKYAFNAIQRKTLPKQYRCPDGTGGGHSA